MPKARPAQSQDKTRRQLRRAFQSCVDPVPVPRPYPFGLGVRAFATALLPLACFAVIGLAAYEAVWCAIQAPAMLEDVGRNVWSVLRYSGPNAMGLVAVSFLTKSLFARSSRALSSEVPEAPRRTVPVPGG